MSELINTPDVRGMVQRNLLATASALAIIGNVAAADVASADDAERPTAWIEFGGQLERASGGDPAYSPSFFDILDPQVTSPSKIVDQLPMGFGPEGKISFQPHGSDLVLSAGVRYGRAISHRNTHQEAVLGKFTDVLATFLQHYYSPGGAYYYYKWKCCSTKQVSPNGDYADVQSRHQENHVILDFQAGKDVGLGLFGKQGTSNVSAGVRFAQFVAKSELKVKARGDTSPRNLYARYANYLQFPEKYSVVTDHRAFSLTAGSSRSFSGFGPSISWDASATLLGQADTSEVTFDWGVNAAVLFGKQKAETNHQSSGFYLKSYSHLSAYNNPRVDFDRSRNVVVPNIGGMAGFSVRFPNAKVSFGYRADVFFGAIDGGIDTRKTYDRAFYGPFANFSIGL